MPKDKYVPAAPTNIKALDQDSERERGGGEAGALYRSVEL